MLITQQPILNRNIPTRINYVNNSTFTGYIILPANASRIWFVVQNSGYTNMYLELADSVLSRTRNILMLKPNDIFYGIGDLNWKGNIAANTDTHQITFCACEALIWPWY